MFIALVLLFIVCFPLSKAQSDELGRCSLDLVGGRLQTVNFPQSKCLDFCRQKIGTKEQSALGKPLSCRFEEQVLQRFAYREGLGLCQFYSNKSVSTSWDDVSKNACIGECRDYFRSGLKNKVTFSSPQCVFKGNVLPEFSKQPECRPCPLRFPACPREERPEFDDCGCFKSCKVQPWVEPCKCPEPICAPGQMPLMTETQYKRPCPDSAGYLMCPNFKCVNN
jgi:hypothetical protein